MGNVVIPAALDTAFQKQVIVFLLFLSRSLIRFFSLWGINACCFNLFYNHDHGICKKFHNCLFAEDWQRDKWNFSPILGGWELESFEKTIYYCWEVYIEILHLFNFQHSCKVYNSLTLNLDSHCHKWGWNILTQKIFKGFQNSSFKEKDSYNS